MKIRAPHGPAATIVFLLLTVPLLAVPDAAEAQQATQAIEIPEEKFETFVKVHLAIEEVRDDHHEEMAVSHEDFRREEARERANERIRAVLEEHDVTLEQYEEFTRIISIDQERREAFEELRARIDG